MSKVQHVKRCMKQTKLTLEISCPADSFLAQLSEHETEDLEAVGSNPTGGNLKKKKILICHIICQKCVRLAYREKPDWQL